MTTEIIKQFNDILDSFLIQVSPLVGTTYHYHYQRIIKINSILAIEQFLVFALPMRDKILSRDESYFNDNTNHKDKIGNNENILNEIVRLQGIYSKLDTVSKSNVWDILQALLVLGEEYIKIKYSKK
jgi:hypothetical protein